MLKSLRCIGSESVKAVASFPASTTIMIEAEGSGANSNTSISDNEIFSTSNSGNESAGGLNRHQLTLDALMNISITILPV